MSADCATNASARNPVGWRAVLALYPAATASFKLRFCIRWHHGKPFDRLEQLLPQQGTIVDIGCGSGILANFIALRAPARTVLGLDIDPRQIARACSSIGSRGNIQFEVRDLMQQPLARCDAVVMVDVLHHMRAEQQDHILRACRAALAPAGALYLLDVDIRPRWKYHYNRLFDSLTGLAGITQGSTLFYQSPAQLSERLTRAGFASVQVTPFARHDLAPRVLYVARPTANGPAPDRGPSR